MPEPGGGGMAPFTGCSEFNVRRRTGDSPDRPWRRKHRYARQDKGGDSEGDSSRRRFRSGNDGGGGGNGDGDGRDRGFFRGGGRRKGDFGSGNGDRNGNGDRDGRGKNDRNGNRNGSGSGDGNRGDTRTGGGFGGDRSEGNNGDQDSSATSNPGQPNPTPSLPPSSSLPEQPPASAGLSQPPTESLQASTDAAGTFNPGVVLLQSQVSATPTVGTNPTATSLPPAVTSDAGSTNLSEDRSNGEPPSASSGAEPPIPPAPTSTPSPSILPSGPPPLDNGSIGGPNNSNRLDAGSGLGDASSNRLEPSRAGMDPTAERVLISVGSIGGFILVCFVVWMVWRTTKKSKRGGKQHGEDPGGILKAVASKMPFFRRRGWQTLDNSPATHSPPPSYPEKTGVVPPSTEGFFGPEKVRQDQSSSQQGWPMAVPNVIISEPTPMLQPKNIYQPAYYPPRNDLYASANRPVLTLVTNMPPYTHQPQESFSSTNAAQFGTVVTTGASPNSATPQTGVSPSAYYSQALLAQQHKAPPYQPPIYRQPSQAISDVSSISSGYGDGELVSPPAPTFPAGPQNTYTTRFSWMSQPQKEPQGLSYSSPLQQQQQQGVRQMQLVLADQTTSDGRDRGEGRDSTASGSSSGSGGGGDDDDENDNDKRRETVYTQASEDRPARFRSVGSWVDQQAGRIRRAQAQVQLQQPVRQLQVPGNPGIPGIHNPPPEEPHLGMLMMANDGEVPRRVEDVIPGLRFLGGNGGLGN